MPINLITDNAWGYISNIQNEAYVEITPEDIHVLKSKWQASPKTCAVYVEGGKVLAYLLAHPWQNKLPPKLNEVCVITESTNLYLHDLALSSEAMGKGIAKKLVTNLINIARTEGFNKIFLVAIQQSSLFWERFGFLTETEAVISKSYGDNAKLMVLDLNKGPL